MVRAELVKVCWLLNSHCNLRLQSDGLILMDLDWKMILELWLTI